MKADRGAGPNGREATRGSLESGPDRDRLPLLLVLVCFALLAVSSWGKFEYPTIDFGREVDIPARLLTGQVLYRDVETFYGPLAYYANAAALALLGHRVEVFLSIGLALALVAVLLVYSLARRLTDERWAALCALCVVVYSAFSPGGLFSFVGPYSYGAVYATVFCLLAFVAVDRYGAQGKLLWLLAAAVATALAGLAKQEYGVAGLIGVVAGSSVGPGLPAFTRLLRGGLAVSVSGLCVLGALGPLAARVTWKNLLQSLAPVGNLETAGSSSLFRVSLGKTVGIWAQGLVIFIVALAVVSVALAVANWLGRRKGLRQRRRLAAGLEMLVALVLSWAGMSMIRWVYVSFLSGVISGSPNAFFHPLGKLSWTLPVLVVWALANWRRILNHRHSVLLVALIVFSQVLNSRWLFHIGFYGLYATAVVIVFFVMLHDLASARVRNLPVRRLLMIWLLIGGAMHAAEFLAYRHAIHSSRGSVYTNQARRAEALNMAIRWVESSDATSVFVLPEGALLNFLTGTSSPSRKTTFLPVDLPSAEDELEFLRQLESDPPEIILYLERSFREWGYETYAEFNPLVDRWVTEEHELVATLPDATEPIVRVFRRRVNGRPFSE